MIKESDAERRICPQQMITVSSCLFMPSLHQLQLLPMKVRSIMGVDLVSGSAAMATQA